MGTLTSASGPRGAASHGKPTWQETQSAALLALTWEPIYQREAFPERIRSDNLAGAGAWGQQPEDSLPPASGVPNFLSLRKSEYEDLRFRENVNATVSPDLSLAQHSATILPQARTVLPLLMA